MPNTSSSGRELVDRLFVPQERWGWEFVEPEPAALYPSGWREPVWREPAAPDVSRWTAARKKAQSKLPDRLLVTVIVAVIVGIVVAFLGGDGVPIGISVLVLGCAVVGVTLLVPWVRAGRILHDAAQQRAIAAAQFQMARWQWETQVQAHRYAEWQRREAASRWYPLRPLSSPSRVDVFGGTGDGWASLVVTLGSSLLSLGGNILVLDFSEQQVADPLAEFAIGRRHSVATIDLPGGSRSSELLAGLDTEQLAEVIAESVHTMRQGNQETDFRVLDAELIRVVAEHLAEPSTFMRLVGGLRVLRRVYDMSAVDGPLTTSEIQALSAQVDMVGRTERDQNELQFLTSMLELLSKDDPDTPTGDNAVADRAVTEPLWPATGLTVVSTTGGHPRRKDFLDRLLFHRVLHALRTRANGSGEDVVIVAGADHLGLVSLEELAKQARRIGIRLILLLEHLRGDLEQLLGSSDSATVLMRLGNAQEAAKAAEFIGRGHKFVLSQLTDQIGRTFTEGTAESFGIQYGTADTTGTTDTGAKHQGTSKSTTQSRSHTWQSTVNQSIADSATIGTTNARVYEFAVEPTTIQGLPPTAYLLVESGASGRRVVMADCNPGIALLDKVSAVPRGQS